jgi:hypothetical protein
MIKGTYTFYEDGKVIAKSENIVTKFGKRFLTNFIAGNIDNPSKDIALGISTEKVVSSATSNGTVVTYTTAAAHGLTAGNKVSISNMSASKYNLKNYTVASVPTSTTFTVASTISSGSSTAAGSLVSDIDTRLGFEFYKMPITLASTDIQTSGGSTSYAVIYKGTIPQDVSGVISEVGIYPSAMYSTNNFDSKFISDFSNYLNWYTLGGAYPQVTSTDAKIGSDMLKMTAYPSDYNPYGPTYATETYYSNLYLDLSGYSVNDTFKLAYYKHDTNLTNMTISFYSSDYDYYTLLIAPKSGTGYKISDDISLADLSVYGTPDKSNIVKVSINLVSQDNLETSVSFDGLRINDEDTFNPGYGIISRSILDSPYLTKLAGRQVDVEYKLELSF